MKRKILITGAISSIITLIAYASINLTIDSSALSNSSILSSLLPSVTDYSEISGLEDVNGDTEAETIVLTQLTKGSEISSIDLNAKFASMVIMHLKQKCELLETGVYDDVEKDCDIDDFGAASCSDYKYFKTCTENLSGLQNCVWQDVGGNNFACVDNTPTVVSQITNATAYDTANTEIQGNIEFDNNNQAFGDKLGRIRIELDNPADFCALHVSSVSLANEVAFSGASSCGNDGVDYCDIDNFTGNYVDGSTYLLACNTGGTYSNSVDITSNLVIVANVPSVSLTENFSKSSVNAGGNLNNGAIFGQSYLHSGNNTLRQIDLHVSRNSSSLLGVNATFAIYPAEFLTGGTFGDGWGVSDKDNITPLYQQQVLTDDLVESNFPSSTPSSIILDTPFQLQDGVRYIFVFFNNSGTTLRYAYSSSNIIGPENAVTGQAAVTAIQNFNIYEHRIELYE